MGLTCKVEKKLTFGQGFSQTLSLPDRKGNEVFIPPDPRHTFGRGGKESLRSKLSRGKNFAVFRHLVFVIRKSILH